MIIEIIDTVINTTVAEAVVTAIEAPQVLNASVNIYDGNGGGGENFGLIEFLGG